MTFQNEPSPLSTHEVHYEHTPPTIPHHLSLSLSSAVYLKAYKQTYPSHSQHTLSPIAAPKYSISVRHDQYHTTNAIHSHRSIASAQILSSAISCISTCTDSSECFSTSFKRERRTSRTKASGIPQPLPHSNSVCSLATQQPEHQILA